VIACGVIRAGMSKDAHMVCEKDLASEANAAIRVVPLIAIPKVNFATLSPLYRRA